MTVYCHHPVPCPRPHDSASAQTKRNFRPGRMYTHLTADTVEELVKYACSVGLNLEWIQHPDSPRFFHFDVTGMWLNRIMRDSQVEKLDVREFGSRLMNKVREHNKEAQDVTPETTSQ